LLPEALLKYSVNRDQLIPHYLDESDHPWLRLIWDEYLGFVGKPKADLKEKLNAGLPFSSPPGKRQMVSHLLNRIFRTQVSSIIPPRELRARLFVVSAGSSLSRTEVCNQVGSEFGIHSEELENSIYADLPIQRCLMPPIQLVATCDLALRTNLMLVQGLLARARSVEIRLAGNSSSVIRHAKRKGLICVVNNQNEEGAVTISLSGPYSLFRRTLLYGQAMGTLVPVLAWCNYFEMSGEIVTGEKSFTLKVRSGDPIFPSDPPKSFDSKLEERFRRMFLKATKVWDIIREPEPVNAVGTLIFPDFGLRHREDPSRYWLLEIVGYWTPDYLRKKLEKLREAKIPNLLLCVSDKLNCSEGDIPEGALVIRFSRQLQPADVLRLIEPEMRNN
jgi:predicted nuclease of restriction endonuclease-like RecB superfamily